MRLVHIAGGVLAMPWFLVCIGAFGGIRVNTTPSIPVGMYRVSSGPVRRGSYVMFCPPNTPVFLEARERGYIGYGDCDGDFVKLMKLVVAVEGDRVEMRSEGVFVNGELVPHSARRAFDESGRPLPQPLPEEQRLGSQQWLLMSRTNDESFDSRYFGPLQLRELSHIAPLFVWETRHDD